MTNNTAEVVLEETLARLIDHLLVGVDDLATVILKGHLLVLAITSNRRFLNRLAC
jgi:hypothetical protein